MAVGYNLSLVAPYLWLIIVFSIWEGAWKGIALWRSGKNGQLAWFVVLFVINTLGILPIIYLLFFQKSKRPARKQARSSRGRSRNPRSRR